MEKNKLQDFFNQIKNIAERYEKIQRLQGENFNIFSILGRESNEEKTHSNFLAELLNPKGSHGQGAIFLKKFIAMLNEKDFIKNEEDENEKPRKWNLKNFNCENANVQTEVDFGNGRMDILITSENKKIAIENKIYAGEQNEQLKRYGEYLKKECPKKEDRALLFLTLWGNESTQDFKEYDPISYRDDILKWLQECRKEVATFPVIREGITHYINLIKKLTNQNTHNEMNEEIKKVVKENLEALKIIMDEILSEVGIMEQLAIEYFYELAKEVVEEHFKDKDLSTDGYSIFYYKNKNKYTIEIGAWKKTLDFGFNVNQPNHENLREKLKAKGYKSVHGWAGYKTIFGSYDKRSIRQFRDAILEVKNNPEDWKNKIREIFTELITAVDEVEQELQK